MVSAENTAFGTIKWSNIDLELFQFTVVRDKNPSDVINVELVI